MITYGKFWETIKRKKISQYVLVNKYNISKSTIDRLRHNKPLSTVTIDMLCDILNCNVSDILDHK